MINKEYLLYILKRLGGGESSDAKKRRQNISKPNTSMTGRCLATPKMGRPTDEVQPLRPSIKVSGRILVRPCSKSHKSGFFPPGIFDSLLSEDRLKQRPSRADFLHVPFHLDVALTALVAGKGSRRIATWILTACVARKEGCGCGAGIEGIYGGHSQKDGFGMRIDRICRRKG
jgi:hypothetical protein